MPEAVTMPPIPGINVSSQTLTKYSESDKNNIHISGSIFAVSFHLFFSLHFMSIVSSGYLSVPALCIALGCLFISCQTSDLQTAAGKAGGWPGDSLAFGRTKPEMVVYLSFDDGPQQGTDNCIRICEQANAKATFFMVGMHYNSPQRQALANQVRQNPRFLMANHSFTHAYQNHYRRFYGQVEAAWADFQQAETTLQVPVRMVRFPGNNTWALQGQLEGTRQTRPLARLMDSLGYRITGWDVEWNFRRYDKMVQNAGQMMADVDKLILNKEWRTPGHLVILAHDRMFQRPEDSTELVHFVELIKARRGWVFETMDHYPGVQDTLQPVPLWREKTRP